MADESYWEYKASTSTPTLWDAILIDAVPKNTSEKEWYKLSPGMRREIVRAKSKNSG
jgi:hypothetical protein